MIYGNDSNCICRSNCCENWDNDSSRQGNNGTLTASNENWCCISREGVNPVARIGNNNSSNNELNCGCNNETGTNNTNEPVIILTNDGNLRNNKRRNCCQCRR